MSRPEVVKVSSILIVLHNTGGELAAVARKVSGGNEWAVRRHDSRHVEFVTGEPAVMARLAEIAERLS